MRLVIKCANCKNLILAKVIGISKFGFQTYFVSEDSVKHHVEVCEGFKSLHTKNSISSTHRKQAAIQIIKRESHIDIYVCSIHINTLDSPTEEDLVTEKYLIELRYKSQIKKFKDVDDSPFSYSGFKFSTNTTG